MFTVKECTEQAACGECDAPGSGSCPLCERLGGNASDGDRIFVLYEDGPRAAGVLGLRHGKVIVKGVYGALTPAYRDLMVRSLLHVCRCMQPITVRVDTQDDYYASFGFAPKEGGMEVRNTQIVFH